MEKIKITVLDAATLGDDIDLSLFDTIGKVTVYSLTQEADIVSRLQGQDVCILNKIKLTADILKQLPNLRLICVAATGYDNIDTDACRRLGIALCNVAGYSANSVSQLTVAMVLSASVHLPTYRRAVSDGSYTAGGVQNILTPVYHELAGKTWGIIGYGGIGQKVGAVAKALGCHVLVHKRTPVEGEECVSLEELLRRSDVITVHVPLTDQTRSMIGKNELAMMKKNVILINVARGAVLDEAAVAESIEEGHIGFFGCDVYSVEPMPQTHPLYRVRDRENVCLTPHIAWGAFEARQRCMQEIEANIQAFLREETRNRIV